MSEPELNIDQLFADYLATPKAQRTGGSNRRARRSTTKLPRPEWMPEARSVRVTPRGKPLTSWYRAAKIAEESLSVRVDPSIPRLRKQLEGAEPNAAQRR